MHSLWQRHSLSLCWNHTPDNRRSVTFSWHLQHADVAKALHKVALHWVTSQHIDTKSGHRQRHVPVVHVGFLHWPKYREALHYLENKTVGKPFASSPGSPKTRPWSPTQWHASVQYTVEHLPKHSLHFHSNWSIHSTTMVCISLECKWQQQNGTDWEEMQRVFTSAVWHAFVDQPRFICIYFFYYWRGASDGP